MEEYVVLAEGENRPSSIVSAFLQLVQTIIIKIVNLVLLLAPSFVTKMLSKNYQVTLSLSSILMAIGILMVIGILVVRYKYLTGYSKNTKGGVHTKSSDNKKTKSINLVDSVENKEKKDSRSTNYLDEFLSAIKSFGYLERPVFHELTKNMTTQRVAADEILHVDESLGFSIVVEGTIQVFIKLNESANKKQSDGKISSSEEAIHDGDQDDDDNDSSDDRDGLNFDLENDDYKGDTITIGTQKYQLLNEVKSGAPLSSLMSALDLFKVEDSVNSIEFSNTTLNSPILSPRFTVSGNASPISDQGVSPFDGDHLFKNEIPKEKNIYVAPTIVYPEIIARPKVENGHSSSHSTFSPATIAIIPRSAFQRVQSKYPKASSHIVIMVLTRLYKVTMNTIHNYLGLTNEIIHSEIKLNIDSTDSKLPRYLRDGVIERFKKNTFSTTNERKHNEDASMSPSSLTSLSQTPSSTTANSTSIGRSNSKSIKSVPSSVRIFPPSVTRTSSSRYVVLDSRSKSTHPGDLLSSVPLSRRPDSRPQKVVEKGDSFTTFSQASTKSSASIRELSFSSDREETEETSLRIAIIENLFKHLGIKELELSKIMQNPLTRFSVSSQSVLSSKSSSTNDLTGLWNAMDAGTSLSTIGRNVGLGSMAKGSIHKNHSYKYETINKMDYFSIEERLKASSNNREISPSLNKDKENTKKQKRSSYSQYDFVDMKHEFSKYLELKYYSSNSVLVEQGKFESGMYYVIDGSLDIVNVSGKNERKLYTVKEGGLAGYLSAIVGFRSLVTIRAPKEKGVIVAYISRKNFSMLSDKFYFVQLPIATKLKSLLSKKILMIDYALEWCHIPAGNVLSAQGDMANGFHIVLSGRFRVVRTEKGQTASERLKNSKDAPLETIILGEYGHGESIGEVEVLTASRRTSSLIAVRDSETARIPRTLFEILSIQNPSIMIKVSRIVADKLMNPNNNILQQQQVLSTTISSSTSRYISTDYKTITILPTTSGLPVREFADKLVHALKSIGRTVISLDQASTLTHLGRHAFDERLSRLKLSGYFAFLEEEYETIVYICDSPLRSNWTSTCISQGDCILLLADAEDKEIAASVGDYEKLLLRQKTTARTDLCLIHPEKYVEAGSTSFWLKNRIWVQGHHHIQMEITRENTEEENINSTSASYSSSNLLKDFAAKMANPNLKLKLGSKTLTSLVKNLNDRRIQRRSRRHGDNSITSSVATHKNDFLRLARILSNEAVGLVLGGGGSRGISHVGIVAALEKHGIPIDLIGGTSIGSFVGGLYAKDYNSVSIYGRAKIFSMRVSSLWRSILDLTYPVTSYITGYEFNRGIWKTFGSSEIEDFWLKFYCNSTNITNSTMDIHETGYSWRFIRASMSLAGLLPPIAYDGCMLLDGGYLDNLPVDEMKKKGAKYIIAVDVGSADDRTPMNYGDTLSGFWVLFNRWNPFSQHPNVPNMMDIQSRLAYVASVNALEIAKRTPGVIYLRPPIENYATLDFAKFDEIYHVGMNYAEEFFLELDRSGKFPQIAGRADKSKKVEDPNTFLQRRNSI
ncbi:lysophospholipase Nte1p [[Candida] railenensis]|uniref:Lysophospholipase NTE1 n=1 Tax=[Candida] railenensis TaxID=45579 RepID=A0A9P0VZI7_9ASCO|nr:lysophospholipase Nte1p [[Candida] railenensis]